MNECLFCQIIAGKIPCYKIYEDQDYLAFLDIFPKTEGHTLVIPKQHVEKVWDYSKIGQYWETVTKIVRHLKQISGEEIRALVYGFDVPHAHVHLMPGQENNLTGQQLSGVELAKIRAKYEFKA